MRVGIDAKRAFATRTGLGEYSRRLINALLKYASGYTPVLFTPVNKLGWYPEKRTPIIFREGVWKRLPAFFWRSLASGKIASRYANLFHGLSNELPKGLSIPSVVTIHDLLFKEHPEWYPAFDRLIYSMKVNDAVKRANLIIAVSEATKQAITNHYPHTEDKIRVIPPMLPEDIFHFKHTPSENATEPYIVFLGRMETRKNFAGVLKALKVIPPGKRPLLISIAGKNAYFKKCLKWAREHFPDLKWKHYSNIPNQEIWKLLRGAVALVYPSFAEGFGMPIAEAAALGVPTIAGDHSAMRQAGGNSAIYVNPNDPEEIASAIETLMNNSELRAQLGEKGRQHAIQFHPKNLVQKLKAVYDEAVVTSP